MKAIRVESEEEFESLLEDISIQVSDAFEPWRLLQGLDAAIPDHASEMNYAPDFWNLVFDSLYESVLSYLGRLYDSRTDSMSLGNFLHTVKSNRQFFSEDAFRRRLSSKPQIDTLASVVRTVDVRELEIEIICVSGNNPIVSCLHEIRNKRVAHRGGHMVRLGESLAGLTVLQIETLLRRASQITTKYGSLFRASSFATRRAGTGDYKDVLQLMKQSIDFNRAQQDEEIRKSIGQE